MLTRNLREATRSVHVSYPVPYLVTLLLLVCLALVGLARAFGGPAGLVLLGAGLLCLLNGLVILCWAVFVRPNLLKSEKFELFERMMLVMGDNEMDAEARERLQALMISHADDHLTPRPARVLGDNSDDGGNTRG